MNARMAPTIRPLSGCAVESRVVGWACTGMGRPPTTQVASRRAASRRMEGAVRGLRQARMRLRHWLLRKGFLPETRAGVATWFRNGTTGIASSWTDHHALAGAQRTIR